MAVLVRASGRPMVHDLHAMLDAVGYVTRYGIEWRVLTGRLPAAPRCPRSARSTRRACRPPTPGAGTRAAMTQARRSTAASDTSPWTPSGCCSPCASPRPASKTATAPTGYWRCCGTVLHHPTGLGRRRLRRAPGNLGLFRTAPRRDRGSNAATTPPDSSSCPAAGSSNAPSAGSYATAAWYATTNDDPTTTKPWSSGPPSQS